MFYKGIDTPLSLEQVKLFIDTQGWKIIPIESNGSVVGALATKGSGLHVSIAPEYQRRWNPAKYFYVVREILDTYGIIESFISKNNSEGIKWMNHIGFKVSKEDDTKLYMYLTKDNFKFYSRSNK